MIRTVKIFAIGLAGIILSAQIYIHSTSLKRAEAFYYASHFYAHTQKNMPIVLVDVSTNTINKYGDFWHHGILFPVFLKNLLSLRPRVVGVDTIFGIGHSPDQLSALAAIAAHNKNIVFATAVADKSTLMPQLQSADPTTGYVDAESENDRHNPFGLASLPMYKSLLPSINFPAQIARIYEQGVKSESSGIETWYKKIVSNDPSYSDLFGCRLVIDFSYVRSGFVSIPFERILESPERYATLVRDKAIVVGTTAESYNDYHATPATVWTGRKTSGLVLVASAVATIVNESFVQVVGVVALYVLLGIFYVLSALLSNRMGGLKGITIAITFYLIVAEVVFLACRYYVPVTPFVFLAIFEFGVEGFRRCLQIKYF